MATDVVIPALGESISEGTISRWLVKSGEDVKVDQPLLELETDKVTAEIPSPAAGVVTELLFATGADVKVGAVVARIGEVGARAAGGAASAAAVPPSVRRIAEEEGVNLADVQGSGRRGQVTKADVLAHLEARGGARAGLGPRLANAERGAPEEARSTLAAIPVLSELEEEARAARKPRGTQIGPEPAEAALLPKEEPAEGPRDAAAREAAPAVPPAAAGLRGPSAGRSERRVRMTRIRRRIAERLKEVQNTAAILTTFNEVDMSAVMKLRKEHGERFQERHGVKLGLLSFFVKASIEALKEFPALNGWIEGEDVVYHDYYDLGVAVSTEKGLVVPVMRDADRLSFAELEKAVAELGKASREGTLSLEQLSGGTFSITNGGVFGSMLSTPILNPPQSGILGLHAIQNRPVAVGDRVEVRPVMYLALSYDHRIVDGAQAVRFLVRVKQLIEEPARLLLDV
jgi:2-oxoglutarate dehydrogenase E2 component (dihydrolipoamide succinyltransferase)